jgi:hypothetical protein
MSSTATAQVDEGTANAIAVEAYTYLYPLVLMDITRRQMTNVVHAGDGVGRAPMDAFAHVQAFPSAEFRDVVRPNFDTLYSVGWLDLREQPRVVSVPDAGENYYLLPLYDMWSEIFACPGTRTTGGVAADYALCGPGWDGDLPEGLERIDAPTAFVWIIGRTKASVETYDQVHAFQNGMRITPLSAWPGDAPAATGTIDPAVDEKTPPLRQAFGLSAKEFYADATRLMQAHPPHFNDGPMLQRMARLGIVAGERFDLDAVDASLQAALTKGAAVAQEKITAHQAKVGVPQEGWITLAEGVGTWGTDYLKRAAVDLAGLGANLPADAIYPLSFLDVDGEPYTGEHDYVLRFASGALPPAMAFWSLTLYDAEGFQVANDLDRFAIGDRDDLTYNDDGSLDLHIEHEPPRTGTSNWLPAPADGFNLCLRIYYPGADALDGTWLAPGVAKVQGSSHA